MPNDDLLNKPVSELNLSVRPRLCLERLGIQTLGELVQRTGAELLATPNFGLPSLAEIREKLAQHGLSLRGD
jgi:DNA-directed RNA polymerase subunit alpha